LDGNTLIEAAGDVGLHAVDSSTNDLTVVAGGTINLNGDIGDTVSLSLQAAVALGATVELDADDTTFSSTIDGNGNALTVTGHFELYDAATDLASLALGGDATLAAGVTTTGTQTYSGTLTVNGLVLLTTGTGAGITVVGAINGGGGGPDALYLDAPGATIDLQGAIGGGANLEGLGVVAAALVELPDVTIVNGAGGDLIIVADAINLNGTLYSTLVTGELAFFGSVTLSGSTIING